MSDDGEVERGLVVLDEEGHGRPGPGDDAAEGPELEPRVEHVAERGTQRDRGGLQVVGQRGAEGARVTGAQGGHQLRSWARAGRAAARVAAQPVALGIHGGGREAALAEREHPVVAAPGQHRREHLAATGAHRGAATEQEGHVAAELGGDLLELLGRQAEAPQLVARDEGRGGVGRATGHATGDRDVLADGDVHGLVDAAARRRAAGRPARRGWCRRSARRRRTGR